MRWTRQFCPATVLICLLMSAQSWAQTVIVVRQDGSGDAASLSAALDELPRNIEAAYVIEFQDSEVYEEAVGINEKIKDGGSLTIRAGDGQAPVLRSDKNKVAALTLTSSSTTLEGLIVEGGDRQEGIHIDWSDDHVIRGCVIRGASSDTPGLYIQGGRNNLIIDNDITGNDIGIELHDAANNNVIRNNRIYRNAERGLWIWKESEENQILQNTFESNAVEIHLGDDGNIKDRAGDNNQFIHNILMASSDGVVLVVRSDEDIPLMPEGTIADYNLLYAPAGATFAEFGDLTIADLSAWQSAAGVDVHTISADPLFVDAPNDLRLSSQSPAIDAGDPATAVGDEPEPNGGRINLGAYGGTAQATGSGPGVALPGGAFNDVTAVATGLGQHEVSIEVTHSGGAESRARLEWATDQSGPFSPATLAGPITADQGTPVIDNGSSYQVTAISTPQSNTIIFFWNSAADVGGLDGTAWLRVTANDGTNDQTTPAVLAVTVDNVAPQGLAALVADEVASSRISFTWTPATTETHFEAYTIWYGTVVADVENRSGGAAAWTAAQDGALALMGTSSTTVTGLQRATTYFAKVWSRDSFGNEASAPTLQTQTTSLDSVIHYVAASGSNNGVANDPAQPWNSIKRAISAIPGDLVGAEQTYFVRILDSSTYTETVTIDNTTDATYNVTVQADQGQTPGLAAPDNKHGFVVKCAYTTIEGLRVEASSKWAINVNNATHATIRNCTVSGGVESNQGGIRLHKASYSRVHDCLIYTNDTGVRISEDTDFASLRNNLILDAENRSNGVYIDKQADADTLINNTIVGYERGIFLRGPQPNDAGDGHVIRNNILADVFTGYHLAKDLGATFNSLDYNDIDVRDDGRVGLITGTTYETLADWRAASGGDANSISLDPLFVSVSGTPDTWDLHLQSQAGHWTAGGFVSDASSSPAIDSGLPQDSVGDETAPNGNRINLGVYGGTAQASRSGGVFVEQGGLPWDTYLFGGVPVVPTDPNPDAVLGDDFPGLGEDPWGVWWRLVRWDPAQADYIYYREDEGPAGNPPDFDPGLGYWIIQWWSIVNDDGSVEGDTVDVTGTPVSSAQDYTIPLQAVAGSSGFNQVANPFLFDIDFADARVGDNQGREVSFADAAAEGMVDAYAYLWDWEEQAYVPVSSTEGGRIPTWRGFWIEQLDPNLNIHLILPPMEAAGGVSKPLVTGRPTAEDWHVEFAVRGTGLLDAGDGPVSVFVQDISNRVGVKRDASRRNDRYDALDLTVLNPAYVYAYFPHGDPDDEESAYWPERPARYTYDYRDPEWDEQSWLFVVETSLSSAGFEWVWTNPGAVPRGYTVALEDAGADTVIIPDLTLQARHEFSASVDEPRRFRLRATYVDVIGDATTDRLVDVEDALAILAHAAGIEPLEAFALEFAEVTGTTPSPASVSSYDAAWVLRYDEGLVDDLPAATQDLAEGERLVHLSEPVQALDGTYTIPLVIQPADGVLSGDLQIRVNAEEIEVLDVTTGQLPRGQIAFRTAGNQLTIGLADATGAKGVAVLARLHVRAKLAVQDVIEHIELTSVELNEAQLAARVVAARPAEAFLYPAAPNPFNSNVQIRFGLPEDTTLDLAIYNVLGQRVRELSSGAHWEAGIHRVAWDGRNDAGQGVGSGVYFVQTSTPTWQAVQKIALIR